MVSVEAEFFELNPINAFPHVCEIGRHSMILLWVVSIKIR